MASRPRWPELRELTRHRALAFVRQPEAVFWTFAFPMILAAVLGFAFKGGGPAGSKVGVLGEGMEAMGDDSCVVQIRDVDSTRIPLRCAEGTRFPAAGTRLRLEIWFRDATLYSLGS